MYCHILRVRAIPTLESTDSMIYLRVLNLRLSQYNSDTEVASTHQTKEAVSLYNYIHFSKLGGKGEICMKID